MIFCCAIDSSMITLFNKTGGEKISLYFMQKNSTWNELQGFGVIEKTFCVWAIYLIISTL